LAKTERLTVFGTVHAPLIPPLIAAKEFVTADHIGEGRFGLNLVCGWNECCRVWRGRGCANGRTARLRSKP
jgi:alkanesulfonate monooxygenase SsuD/methylene tetrahydromethanopterin reductase-like flavin-dependent oxidoreductase (luciferase family)